MTRAADALLAMRAAARASVAKTLAREGKPAAAAQPEPVKEPVEDGAGTDAPVRVE